MFNYQCSVFSEGSRNVFRPTALVPAKRIRCGCRAWPEGRLAGSDFSLNATQSTEDEGREWIDALEDESDQASETVENSHDTDTLRQWLLTALSSLNDREQFIVRERKLRDQPRTLESLGGELGLSKERVRQLEAAAFGKMRKALENQSREVHHFLV